MGHTYMKKLSFVSLKFQLSLAFWFLFYFVAKFGNPMPSGPLPQK